MKKTKERREEPLGTMSYQTSSKRSPPFCLLIGQKNTVFWHQSEVRTAPFFTFLCAIFSHPFRPSLAPTIRPWVSEDHLLDVGLVQVSFHAMYLHLLLQCASWLKKILVISDGHPVSSVGKAPLYQTRGCRFKPWPYILRQYFFFVISILLHF